MVVLFILKYYMFLSTKILMVVVQFRPGTSTFALSVIMPIVNLSMDLGSGVIFIIFTEYIRCVRIVQYSDRL
jgi:uncharacterized membrane protein YwaF